MAGIHTAQQVAETVLAWAKVHNLFTQPAIEEAVEISQPPLSKENAFRAQAVEEILRKRGINLIGFNEAEKKVVIFTHGKLSKSDERIVPFHVDGMTFEYLQGGVAQVKGDPPPPENPRPFYLHNDLYCCGSSIYPAHCIGAGTFGFIARDQDDTLFGVSNNHVTGACNSAMPGLPILAPGPIDAKEDACDPFTIGRHTRLLPINDGIPENIPIADNCDAGCFKLSDPRRVSSMQGIHFDTPAIVVDPAPGSRVEKVGRTTGLTRGRIVAQSASPIPVNYQISEYSIRKTVYFERVYIVQSENDAPFSRPGDSGSLVVSIGADGSRKSVGIVFAGNEQRRISFILPLPEILDKLGLTIVSGHNV